MAGGWPTRKALGSTDQKVTQMNKYFGSRIREPRTRKKVMGQIACSLVGALETIDEEQAARHRVSKT